MRRLFVLSLVSGLLVGLVGCSSGSKPESAKKPTTSTSAATTTVAGGSSSTTAGASTTAPCPAPAGDAGEKNATGNDTALLTGVAITPGKCADTVTFTFRDPGVTGGPGYSASYADPPFQTEGEGRTVEIPGSAFLAVRLTPAQTGDFSTGSFQPTYTGSDTVTATGAAYVTQVRTLGTFEGQSTWVIGLTSKRPFTVTTEPTRVIVTLQ